MSSFGAVPEEEGQTKTQRSPPPCTNELNVRQVAILKAPQFHFLAFSLCTFVGLSPHARTRSLPLVFGQSFSEHAELIRF